MTTKLKKMWELAIEEATKLRKFATDPEKKKLNAKKVFPQLKAHCIYGQMTGHCESERAQELIMLSCNKVYDTTSGIGVSEVKLNGKPKPMGSGRTYIYVSPIEALIFSEFGGEQAVDQLVPFIKGETNKITIPVATETK